MEIGGERGDAAFCDFRVLVQVLTDAVEVFDVAGPPQQLHEVLVVGDDQQLEVTLARATLNDSEESEKEKKVLTIQISFYNYQDIILFFNLYKVHYIYNSTPHSVEGYTKLCPSIYRVTVNRSCLHSHLLVLQRQQFSSCQKLKLLLSYLSIQYTFF